MTVNDNIPGPFPVEEEAQETVKQELVDVEERAEEVGGCLSCLRMPDLCSNNTWAWEWRD